MTNVFPLVLFALLCGACSNRQTGSNSAAQAGHSSAGIPAPAFLQDTVRGKVLPPDRPISDFIRRMFQDESGAFWLGTNSDGVCRYNGSAIECFSPKEGLAGYQVTGILSDRQGRRWFSTDEGVSVFDGRTFTSFRREDGLSSNRTWCVFEDSRGTIWAGTEKGPCRFDGRRFVPFPLPAPSIRDTRSAISPAVVWCIAEDQQGNLWFGTDGDGAYRYDGAAFQHVATAEGLCDNSVTAVRIDRLGKVWFATMFGGVSRYDGKSFTSFTKENGRIGDNEVWTISEDRQGNIWFGAEGYGVYRYDGQSLVNFSARQGLDILAVQCIYEDRTGRLWFGGGGGVSRYDGKEFVGVGTSGPWE